MPSELIDHNILSIAATLVGKFIGPRLNIDLVQIFSKNKWDLKGQVEVTAIAKGFMFFEFFFPRDYSKILCAGN